MAGKAKNYVAAPQASGDRNIAGDGQVGQDKPRNIPLYGPIEQPPIEPVPSDVLKNADKLDLEAFMNEPVDVIVLSSPEKNAEAIVTVYCNGVPQAFIRGKMQTVKRRYVEALARAKRTTYDVSHPIDQTTGEPINRAIPHTGLRYPFHVVKDTSRGAAWLEKVLAEAA